MSDRTSQGPDLSLVMPCYNEEEVLGYTIPRLLGAFNKAGYRVELVAVDNGSRDRTGEIIATQGARDPRVVPVRVERNQGYGYGILAGIQHCTAPWVGMVAADGQVDAEDVIRLYEAVIATNGRVLGKVRRRFRMDGFLRKIVSVAYNLYVRLLWPGLQSIDMNGNPRIMRREVLRAMGLKSTNWLLDPEMMVKAHYMGLRVIELNVFARMRSAGLSHVRAATCWEFFRSLLEHRFSSEWRQDIREVVDAPKKAMVA
jgi:glycosyltransferase involved in cell wall biosynthesis